MIDSWRSGWLQTQRSVAISERFQFALSRLPLNLWRTADGRPRRPASGAAYRPVPFTSRHFLLRRI